MLRNRLEKQQSARLTSLVMHAIIIRLSLLYFEQNLAIDLPELFHCIIGLKKHECVVLTGYAP